MMLPALLVLTILALYPLYWVAVTAFRVENLFNPAAGHWAGFRNFEFLLARDDTFWKSIRLSLIWCLSVVAIQMSLGFALALLLDRSMRGIGILRTLLVIPVFIAPVALGLTWRYMYEPVSGVLNYLLTSLGFARFTWHTSPDTAFIAVMLPEIWQWTPFVTLILLAGIQSISPEIVEAARLDGVRGWVYLRRIVLPMIWPVVAMVLLLRLVDSIRIFDMIYVITRGGPGSATLVASVDNFTMFQSGRLGTTAAYGLIIVVVIDVVVVFFLRILHRQEKRARTAPL
jgi:multiple sugar transport system permease protein